MQREKLAKAEDTCSYPPDIYHRPGTVSTDCLFSGAVHAGFTQAHAMPTLAWNHQYCERTGKPVPVLEGPLLKLLDCDLLVFDEAHHLSMQSGISAFAI